MKYFSDDNNIWLASYGIEAKLGDVYKLLHPEFVHFSYRYIEAKD